jgi:hypothetical protein
MHKDRFTQMFSIETWFMFQVPPFLAAKICLSHVEMKGATLLWL